MATRRRSSEPGHRRKLLVVVDDTSECMRAVTYGARRAALTGASLVMASVIVPEEAQAWLGVGDIMQAEAEEAASQRLAEAADVARGITGLEPERVMLTGAKAEQITRLIDQDEDIAVLFLAAGADSDGPGPLVTHFFTRAASFPIPILLVPGALGEDDFNALA